MKKLVLLAGIVALAACAGEKPAAEETAAAEAPAAEAAAAPAEAMAPDGKAPAGTYEVVDAEKKTATLTLAADNTYTFKTETGEIKGTVAEKDGKACYDPEGDKDPVVCWTNGKADAAGSWTATSDNGQTVTVKRTSA